MYICVCKNIVKAMQNLQLIILFYFTYYNFMFLIWHLKRNVVKNFFNQIMILSTKLTINILKTDSNKNDNI